MNQAIEFKLDGSEYIELKNILKVTGLCETGGEAKQAIEHGLVTVNGVLETRKGLKLKPGHVIIFKNQQIKVLA